MEKGGPPQAAQVPAQTTREAPLARDKQALDESGGLQQESPVAQRKPDERRPVSKMSHLTEDKLSQLDSSMDSASSKVVPFNSDLDSVLSEASETVRKREAPKLSPPRPKGLGRTFPRSFAETVESLMKSRDAKHHAYWADLQNRLPLPLTTLMEEEALEILTRSLTSYRRGIGKDHKLTQQLQQHVEQLRQNLENR
ncbi:cation channel sperm-associated auxiliary subunit zeta [Macrotis lagotis]|uniref:cation channel sperm-associated auxiliary subunit zeta n=1 Tax=Macrotis lagotis TaxID=92651 RepID=UPI003D698B01